MGTQITAVWAVARKDLALWLRRPSIIGVTIFPPLILLLVLILQAASVTNEPVAIVNQDSGPAASALQNVATNYAGFNPKVESAAAAGDDYQALRVSAVLTIPKGFSAALSAGGRPDVLWQVRNFNADSANDLQRGVADVLNQFLATGAAGPNPIHITASEQDLHSQDAGFVGFQLIAVLVMLLMQAGLINAGMAAALEWRTGSVKELILAPVSSTTLVLGKVVAGAIAADLAGAVVFVVARLGGWLPGLSWTYGLIALGVMTLFGMFGAAVGVALATRVRGIEQVNLLSFVVSLYLFFLTGGIAAVQYLPSWLRGVAHAVPNTYATDALRDTLLYGSVTGIALDLIVLAVASVLMVGIAVPAMRRGLAH